MADPAVVASLLLTEAKKLEAILPVAMPDVNFDPPADGRYLRADLFTNAPAWEGVSSGRMDQGLLQITVVWPKGEGLLEARRVAAQVLAAFPKGHALTGPATRVKVNREPWVASPITEDAQTLTPITIPWVAS